MALVVFDLDDTLVDRQAAHRRWAEAFCASMGGSGEDLAYMLEVDHDGTTDRDVWCAQIRERFALDEPVAVLRPRWHAEYLDEYVVDARTLDALVRLREAGHRIGIVTNGPASQIDKITRNDLHSYVDGYVTSDVTGARKPHPDIFEAVAKECECSLDDGWMVGDSAPADMAGGRAVGFATIWIHRGRAWNDVKGQPDPFNTEQRLPWEPLPDDWSPDHHAADVSAAVDIILGVGQ